VCVEIQYVQLQRQRCADKHVYRERYTYTSGQNYWDSGLLAQHQQKYKWMWLQPANKPQCTSTSMYGHWLPPQLKYTAAVHLISTSNCFSCGWLQFCWYIIVSMLRSIFRCCWLWTNRQSNFWAKWSTQS